MAAFQHVRENIEDLNGRVGARDTDLIFLKGLMESPVMTCLVQVQDHLEEKTTTFKPVSTNNVELLRDVCQACRRVTSRDAQELANILSGPHFSALLNAHDAVATKSYEPAKPLPLEKEAPAMTPEILNDTIRMVGIRKNDDEPLGITVRVENDNLIIARILAGGIIDRQGLLHIGDTILEVNGIPVHTPEQLQLQLKKAQGSVAFKILPSYHDSLPTFQCFVKALYTYDPSKDTLLPCKEIGLAFKQGDILQVLNQEDPNWWQARRVSASGPAGLIPSQELEERRRAFVRPEFDYATKTKMCGTKITKKKRKTMYESKASAEFEKAELLLYEEVARMPPFERKTLVLVGARGVGRRSLKNKLISYDPVHFGTPLPHTSRPIRETETDGKVYYFVSREVMEADIADNKYLEWGEHGGHLYGTKLDTLRAVIRSGKMCVVDCSPQYLKILNTPEFMPYVVFIAAPQLEHFRQMHEYGRHHGYGSSRNLTFDRAMSRHGSRRARTLESLASLQEQKGKLKARDEDLKRTIEESAQLQRAYERYFDTVLVNNNFEKTFEQLKDVIDSLSTEPQWVPISWVY
uniref:Calcium/calmodulin dependent serine protein kinase/membrane associated guanylate kinase n=1 Tax=Rhipicephalus appendiculatus TaxID=34631 RepID=A0A131Z4I8_RHIAP